MFADFDTDEFKIVSLLRISFDGFGCCRVEGKTTKMNSEDSRLLLNAITSDHLEAPTISDVLRRYFQANSDVIWDDALAEHELL